MGIDQNTTKIDGEFDGNTAPGDSDVRVDPHETLWLEFRVTGSRAARDQLILAYEPLVRSVAGRLPTSVRAHWDLSDLCSSGLLGLIDAVDRFSPDSPVGAFSSYATQRIRGAIYDELRRLDWLPRTIRRHVISYRATHDQLSNELGRVPGTNEVLSSMGVEGASADRLLQHVQSSQLTHLEAVDDYDDGARPYRTIDRLVSDRDAEPEPRAMASERLGELRAAIARLPERQRTVVTLHFLGGLTQEQTAAVLGVSGPRVFQIKEAAIQSLRRFLPGVRADGTLDHRIG